MKRSIKSKVVQKVALKLKISKGLATKEGLQNRLDKARLVQENGYNLPKCIKGEISQYVFEGMQCFVFGNYKEQSKHILYLAGGAYTNAPGRLQLKFMKRISKKTKCNITIPIYPKLPTATHKECYDKLIKLYSKLSSEYKDIVLIGDSAGGGLATGLTSYLNNNNLKLPKRLILMSPWIDVSMDNEKAFLNEEKDILLRVYGLKELGKMWAGDSLVNSYLVSPINASFKNFPKTTIFCGLDEILYYDIVDFYNKMSKDIKDVTLIEEEGLGHVYCVYPFSDCIKSFDLICSEIEGV